MCGLLFKPSLPQRGHLPRSRDTYVAIVNTGDGGRGACRTDATSFSPENVPNEVEEALESWGLNSGESSGWRVLLLRG